MERKIADLPEIDESTDTDTFSMDDMTALMAKADKIDAALPQVSGLDKMDIDYDEYARKSIETFDDLIDLGKNVEDRHSAEIFTAASSMMGNALNAKTNKAQKKLEMVKLQLQNAKLEHEKEKLNYLKARHLKIADPDAPQETEGQIITTRNDMLNDIIAGLKNSSDT
jgi:hypothetical protein